MVQLFFRLNLCPNVVRMSYRKGNIILFFLLFFFYTNQSNSQTAKIDSLTNLTGLQEGEELASTCLKLAKEYIYINPEKTVELGEKVLPVAVELKKPELESLAQLTIGSGMTYIGNFAEAKSFIDEGLRIARKINHIENICLGLNALAVYHMNTGDYNKAIALFYECADQAQKGHLEWLEALVRFNIGAIYTSMGKWSKGLKEFKYALEYFKKIGDDSYISRTLTNIAVNYSSWGDYKMSLSYYKKSLESLRSVGDLVGETSVLNNIGEIYKDTGEYEKALEYYQKALDRALELKSKLHEAIPLIGLGEVYWLLENYSLAEQYSNEALKIFSSIEMTEGIARSYHILGEVSLARGDLKDALEYAFKSKKLADESGIMDLQEKVCLLISKVYQKEGDVGKAFRFYKEYSVIKDSLFNKTQSQQLAQLRSEMELQDKESQIELLQRDNQIKDFLIKKQREQVFALLAGIFLLFALSFAVFRYNKVRRKTNNLLILKNKRILDQHKELIKLSETKDRFMAIIGHDLRNPIGAFKDTLEQLADYPEMFPEDVRRQIINELRGEAENTYFLLDNLLLWAKSQKQNIHLKMEPFRINEMIDSSILLNSRLAENKKIKLATFFSGNFTVFADQNMVALILRNLLSNAIKFTPQGGNVQVISKKKDDDFIEISVIDDGIGIPDDMKKHLFDKHWHTFTYGTNNEKGSGLGLMLCSEFIEQNRGTISVESTPGKGSIFRFTLKRHKSSKLG